MGKDLRHSIAAEGRSETRQPLGEDTCAKYLELSSWVPFQSLGLKGTWDAKYPTRRLDHTMATDNGSPAESALQGLLAAASRESKSSGHPAHLHQLAATVLYNLQYQHDWTELSIQTTSTITGSPLPRPLVTGTPPSRAYVHPDEQAEILKAEHKEGKSITLSPEPEWVLPTHINEKWSLKQFAEVFDAIETVPPGNTDTLEQDDDEVGAGWRGKNRQKRLLLSTLHDDSTVVYYIVHDGIVKPRQN
ncbi:hypothetical protein V494_04576 [Pseudogymnoascus sp. VKM F-4513 (FW-928)]|nr:hypothetical protein V494_04576 [Pseudogymnoascus sp. VKM F-4513 (FW-928)]